MIDAKCGAAAGIFGRVLCHPLDTVKTVQFTTGERSLVTTVKGIYGREGIAGFYRGVGIATTGSAPGVALYLSTYDAARQWCDAHGAHGNPMAHLACGFAAEAASCIFWVPIDVIKERMQAQPPSLAGRYRSSFDGVQTVFSNESIRGLYRGYLSTLASFGPFSGVYFMTFEAVKPLLGGTHPSSFWQTMISAGIANAIAALTTNPLDLVKTRLQVQRAVLTVGNERVVSQQFSFAYTGLLGGLRETIRHDGVLSLWRGTGARILFTAPNAALTMTMFDKLKQTATYQKQ
jgi:hypothetical protein